MTRKKKTNVAREQWIAEYRARQPHYERLCSKLQSLLEDLLTSEGVSFQVVEKRAKSVDSFAEKLQREGKGYSDPISEITDFAGLRVILYYVDDVARVSDLIEREFQVDETRSEDKRSILAPDQFGYLSVHKIVFISQSRAGLPEWSGLNELVAEIQIRTVLQHSWAAISHALQYKREQDVPDLFRRRLVRLSGLLELADEEFAALRAQQIILRKNIAEKVSGGNLDIPIDVLSISEFVKSSVVTTDLYNLAIKAGFLPIENWTENLANKEMRSENFDIEGAPTLVQVCEFAGIQTIKHLEKSLIELKPHARAFFQEYLRLRDEMLSKQKVGGPYVSRIHLTTMIILASRSKTLELKDIASEIMWQPDYLNRILNAGRRTMRTKKS